ncbi:MAG: single-stranded-DNA-specific exonuclease RecJ [Pleurocapsa sp.]
MQSQWHLVPSLDVPQWFVEAVRPYTFNLEVRYGAQLLWQRGIRSVAQLTGFINPDLYSPTTPFAFGEEMDLAIARLQTAITKKEKITIWGDFDADGITATSVLWDGLGQFFPQYLQLDYYIPNRLTESHGLNNSGIEGLAASGTKLIVTCDTGSTNLAEIDRARELGIDIIVTDHHTLPETRPDVLAIINPRYLETTHPLYHLSGVAVAYKLVEALYQTLPDLPQQPLEHLLDLVAIGLIADLVELKGDCRYLAQMGIRQLQKQVNPMTANRPGVSRLLELCRRTGDRPTDISFGLGPRINAVSRIHGDASFCVELLTSRDAARCRELAEEAELANTRRKSLQNDTIKQVQQKLPRLDLSTTAVIVLEDFQWQGGVLGLVAGQIAQEYGRPTILLSRDKDNIVRGSARSLNSIDLYQLVKSQAHLLHRFGGHPFAAGLSLPLENLDLFREGINQQLRQQSNLATMMPRLQADLVVTVADLGKDLFYELKLLEPCGMGNPVPKLLIKNCRFTNVWHQNIQDASGRKIQYIKTTFKIWDDSSNSGFPGLWWGHYKDEIPQTICEAIAELDYNTYQKRYELRLIDLRKATENLSLTTAIPQDNLIIDRRHRPEILDDLEIPLAGLKIMGQCPLTWTEIQQQYRVAIAHSQKLVLAYPAPPALDPQTIWQQLIGLAKYLSRTQKPVTPSQLQSKLNLSERTLSSGLEALAKIGFVHQHYGDRQYLFTWEESKLLSNINKSIQQFIDTLEEEQFQKQYFYRVPLETITRQLVGAIRELPLQHL